MQELKPLLLSFFAINKRLGKRLTSNTHQIPFLNVFRYFFATFLVSTPVLFLAVFRRYFYASSLVSLVDLFLALPRKFSSYYPAPALFFSFSLCISFSPTLLLCPFLLSFSLCFSPPHHFFVCRPFPFTQTLSSRRLNNITMDKKKLSFTSLA